MPWVARPLALVVWLLCAGCAGRGARRGAAAATRPPPHPASQVAAEDIARLTRLQLVSDARAEATEGGARPSSIEVATDASSRVSVVSWPDAQHPNLLVMAVVSDGHEGAHFSYECGRSCGSMRPLRVLGDPTAPFARVVGDERTLLVVRLDARSLSVLQPECETEGDAVETVCGAALQCHTHGPFSAIVTSDGIEDSNACLDDLHAIADRLEQLETGRERALEAALAAAGALPPDQWPDATSASPACQQPSARAVAAARRTIVRFLWGRFVDRAPDEAAVVADLDGTGRQVDSTRAPAEFAEEVRVVAGCQDAGGAFLTDVTNGGSGGDEYEAIWRVERGRARELLELDVNAAREASIEVELTGDSAPERVLLTTVWEASECAWWVLSPSWRLPLDLTPCERERAFEQVAVLPSPQGRAALAYEDAVWQWGSDGFAEVTTGHDQVRSALRLLPGGGGAVDRVWDAIAPRPEGWTANVSAPCDDASRVGWATSGVHALRSLGVPRDEAIALVTAPVGLRACSPTSAWETRARAQPDGL